MPTLRAITGSYRMPVTADLDTIPPLTGLPIAADEPEIKNFSYLTTGITGMNTKTPQTFANGTGRYLLGTFDNWGTGWDATFATAGAPPTGSQWDNPNTNDVTWEAALSTVDGTTFYPAQFVRIIHADGTTEELPDLPSSVTIEGGAYAVARVDLGAAKAPGTVLLEHAYVSCASGGHLWRHKADLTGTRGQTVTASNGEVSKVGQLFSGTKPAVAGGDGSGAWASSWRHLDAPPAQLIHPAAVMGDSLTAGDYVWRQFLRANHIPHVHIGRGTETAKNFLLNDAKSAYRRRLAGLGGFTRAVYQYGTNDLATNAPTQTLTLFQSNTNTLVALLKTWGAGEVMVGTLPPTTKSTDKWATLANQTLDMATNQRGKNEQLLLDFNTWLRQDTAYGTVTPSAWHHPSGFYVADWGGAETVMDSSSGDTPSTIAKWKVAGGSHTGDGLHPGSAVAVTDGVGAIPPNLFQQSTGG